MKKLLLVLLCTFSINAFSQATANPAPDISQCGNEVFDLTLQTPIILGNQAPNDFTVNYFLSMADAQANVNPIANPSFYVSSGQQNEDVIFARVTNNNDESFDVTSFTVSWSVVFADSMPDFASCDSFPLPPLQTGNYFTAPNGTGQMLNAGWVITTTQTIFIYAAEGNCTDESSFVVTIHQTPVLDPLPDVYACDSYILPMLPGFMEYYSEPGGTGMMIPAGTAITATQTIYVVASTSTLPNCFSEVSFIVSISQSPSQLTPSRVNSCGDYTLPELPLFYSYYTGPNASGTMLETGHVISSPTTIYVFAQIPTEANCSSDYPMSIEIGAPSVSEVTKSECDNNGDGFTSFDLDGLIPDVTNGLANVSVTFYETLVDAQVGVGSLPSPYYNIAANSQTIWARAQNAEGACYSIVQVQLQTMPCGSISGIVRSDTDGGGCSASDGPAEGIHMVRTHGNEIFHAYTNAQGEYQFTNIPLGVSIVSVADDQLAGGTVFPTAQNFEITGIGNNTVDFCITPFTAINDAAVYFVANGSARPGFPANYTMIVKNFGGSVLSGVVTVSYNPAVESFTASSPFAPGTVSPGLLTFDFSGLQPSATITYGLQFQIMTPPTVQANDVLTYNATVAISGADNDGSNNQSVLNQIVVNSYDPNDMAVSPGESITESEIGNDLVYTIRFQNLGNADAVNVRIENTLDSELDFSTFRPLSASHSYLVERNGNQVVFKFNNINLPGALENEPESHGMISYAIKPISNWSTVGDWIQNYADIYFDFNEAITTNTVTTSLLQLGTNDHVLDTLSVYPNPAHGQVNIHLSDLVQNAKITLTDIQGKIILTQHTSSTETTLDIANVQSGLYFVKVDADGKSVTKKLMVQ